MAIADPSKRLQAIPPYMFQELERRIEEKRAAGIDVISLGIGDPDMPTYDYIVEAMQKAVADPATHQYPSNRGREDFRQAFADFYDRRFGVEIDPANEVIPAIGAKECIYNLCNAFLDPGDIALASDPGYPVYTGGHEPGQEPLCYAGRELTLAGERGNNSRINTTQRSVVHRLLSVEYGLS